MKSPRPSLEIIPAIRQWCALATFMLLLGGSDCAWASQTFFAAPVRAGDGSGVSAKDAAVFRDQALWDRVNRALEQSPVEVRFLAGKYVISSDPAKSLPPLELDGIGHRTNQLVIQGVKAGAVIFTRHADPDAPGSKGLGFFFMHNCQNIVIRNLTFTAPGSPISYATQFDECQTLQLENCHWHDLQGVFYGATGTTGATTRDITYKNCRFERIGNGSHAHMSYNAYGPQHIRFVDCYFEDCSGDYVRFRDHTEYGVVTGCTFRSTGHYTNIHATFISVPLFNDDDPASNPPHPNYEYFGTHFLIFKNKFIYETAAKPGGRTAVLFLHKGFSPPGSHDLLTAEEATVLKTGTSEAKKELLWRNMHLNPDTIYVFANTYKNVAHRGLLCSNASYGAQSLGGDGSYDINDLFNATPVVKTSAEALRFFKQRDQPIGSPDQK